jgi:spore coat protein CotF
MNNNQNQNKIGNPETQVPKTPQMNDRDFVNELLATEKYLTNSYSTALNEMSHDSLYQDIQGIFNETQNCQRELYNVMYQNGWYKLEAADSQKLQQSYQQFADYLQQQSPYLQ